MIMGKLDYVIYICDMFILVQLLFLFDDNCNTSELFSFTMGCFTCAGTNNYNINAVILLISFEH